MTNCNQKEEGVLCLNLEQIEALEGRLVRLQGVLTEPATKRFPATIVLEDNQQVTFLPAPDVEVEIYENVSNWYGRKIQARGIIYWKNLPDTMESRLNIPYLLDVDYIMPID